MLGQLQRRARLHARRIGKVKRRADGGRVKESGSEEGASLQIKFLIY